MSSVWDNINEDKTILTVIRQQKSQIEVACSVVNRNHPMLFASNFWIQIKNTKSLKFEETGNSLHWPKNQIQTQNYKYSILQIYIISYYFSFSVSTLMDLVLIVSTHILQCY
uniref:Uncharacterized protein n=1 Tax=Octopus bimaculoides TaxID=37653 RepID=A0A0L8HYR7_OCTBM